MERIFTYSIPASAEGSSILTFLKANGYSNNIIKNLKKTPDGVLLNGIFRYVTAILHENDTLTVTLLENDIDTSIVPVAAPLDILYEDEDIYVINKAAGMAVHPSINHYENTLANALAAYNEAKHTPMTFRCINRLDRDTSGLTIIAKHQLSSARLGSAMKNREIHREYLGIADGYVNDCGTICAPIARTADSLMERQVDFEHGESAVTHFKRLKYENGLSLVSFLLETGRTHQIRVHMKYINHPLIGDFLYNPDDHRMMRQALHAYRLSFVHPVTGKQMSFTAPIPEDFILSYDETIASQLP